MLAELYNIDFRGTFYDFKIIQMEQLQVKFFFALKELINDILQNVDKYSKINLILL